MARQVAQRNALLLFLLALQKTASVAYGDWFLLSPEPRQHGFLATPRAADWSGLQGRG